MGVLYSTRKRRGIANGGIVEETSLACQAQTLFWELSGCMLRSIHLHSLEMLWFGGTDLPIHS